MSPEVREIMKTIKLVHEQGRDKDLIEKGILGVRLLATLKDGRTEEVIIHQPSGHPDAAFSDEDLLNKMSWLLGNVTRSINHTRLLSLCEQMSEDGDVGSLMNECRIY